MAIIILDYDYHCKFYEEFSSLAFHLIRIHGDIITVISRDVRGIVIQMYNAYNVSN